MGEGLTRVGLEMVFDEKVRYCWTDEDGARMSPIHTSMSKALGFVERWPSAYAKLVRKAAAEQQRYIERQEYHRRAGRQADQPSDLRHFEQIMEGILEAQARLTITGKPPAKLHRLVVRTHVEDPTSAESAVAALVLDELGEALGS